ncbi:MAG: hypothetical protein R3314_05245 [Longimicrobiales bacterium]|nr:hypothetical protein [Longimicrobiales bacterium]
MTETRPAATARIVAIMGRGPVTETVRKVLEDEGLTADVRDADLTDNMWRDTRSADALLVDDNLEPAHVEEALERGWIHGTAPVFVVTQRLPGRERYMAWLQAGAWDVLKIPLEAMALVLRLQNILEGGRADQRTHTARRYSLQTLEQVADEALALADRYDRDLYCVALTVDWPRDGDTDPAPVVERLANASQKLVRGSDLVGLADERTLLVLLPDTDEQGALAFKGRLVETLENKLKKWGVLGTLRAETIASEEVDSARELLSLSVRRLGR